MDDEWPLVLVKEGGDRRRMQNEDDDDRLEGEAINPHPRCSR